MSVVACRVTDDSITVAADSIMVLGSTQSKGEQYTTVKLTEVNHLIVGGVGLAEENALLQMFCTTHQPSAADDRGMLEFLTEFADWKRTKTGKYPLENSHIMIVGKTAFVLEGFLIREITTYDAIGAGRDFALAALYLGHSVKKAVKVACELSTYCETPIIQFERAR